MKYTLLIILLITTIAYARDGYPDDQMMQNDVEEYIEMQDDVLTVDSAINISVTGQGVAPSFARTPAQAYALAKRAAMADAYRQLAERIKGVKIQGKDTIKNMAIKSSIINTQVSAMIKNATIAETTFKDGICEVEMEISVNYNSF